MLLSNSDHKHLANLHGVDFVPVCAPDWPQVGRDETLFFERHIVPGYRRVFEEIADRLVQFPRINVVARTGHWGAQFSSERFDLPFLRLALQPCAIRQNGHPASTCELEHLNTLRHDFGLNPLTATDHIPERWSETECLFPKWFGEPETNWPEAGVCTGFRFLSDNHYQPDRELAEFMRNKPVIFSLGSGIQNTKPFIDIAYELSNNFGWSVLLLSGFIKEQKSAASRLLTRRFADHAYVFSKAAAVVHNGGIGTVASALKARLFQVVVPIVWDQPDNALRVERLGFGRALPFSKFSAEAVHSELSRLNSC